MESQDLAPDSEDRLPSQDEGFYVQDVDFRSGIVHDQTPSLMATVAALGGYVPPEPRGAFTYCDLGCGDGTTIIALASVFPEAELVGVDFNPGHVRKGREVAEACGLDNVRFVQASFDELLAQDLPAFDYVAMNGAYAWLEEPLARAVREFLSERLKPGGLFYVEYTSLPGKVSVTPFWHLIQTLVPPEAGTDSRDRARRALELTEKLEARGMRYLEAHRPAASGARSYTKNWRTDPYRIDHFAHNAMASGFRPRYFTEMFDEMAAAGLAYAGRTNLRLNWTDTSVPSAQVPSLLPYKSDLRTTELLKDYIRNEQQRRDVFVRADEANRDNAREFLAEELRLLARRPADTIRRELVVQGGERVPVEGEGVEALIHAADQRAVTPREVAEQEGLPLERVRRSAMRLLATDQFFLCLEPSRPAPDAHQQLASIEIPNPVNHHILARSAERFTRNQLVSPVTGGAAVPVLAVEAILLRSVLETGGFEGAVQHAHRQLAETRKPLRVGQANKPANQVTTRELQQVLQGLRRRKLLNMLRLGIAEPKG